MGVGSFVPDDSASQTVMEGSSAPMTLAPGSVVGEDEAGLEDLGLDASQGGAPADPGAAVGTAGEAHQAGLAATPVRAGSPQRRVLPRFVAPGVALAALLVVGLGIWRPWEGPAAPTPEAPPTLAQAPTGGPAAVPDAIPPVSASAVPSPASQPGVVTTAAPLGSSAAASVPAAPAPPAATSSARPPIAAAHVETAKNSPANDEHAAVSASPATTTLSPSATTTAAALPPATPAASTASPTPTTADKARVVITGDAKRVWLESAAGRYPAGDVAPGTYHVTVFFDGVDPVSTGDITVKAGETRELRCSSQLMVCR